VVIHRHTTDRLRRLTQGPSDPRCWDMPHQAFKLNCSFSSSRTRRGVARLAPCRSSVGLEFCKGPSLHLLSRFRILFDTYQPGPLGISGSMLPWHSTSALCASAFCSLLNCQGCIWQGGRKKSPIHAVACEDWLGF
jgi:hypothetical protein